MSSDGKPIDDSTLYDRVVELFETGRSGQDWFELELRELTGLDVMSVDFEREQGYAIYEFGRFRVLIVRFEDLSVVGSKALAEFLDVDSVEIQRDNVGVNKKYAAAYEDFLSKVQFPARVLADAYDSDYARHFYSARERAAMRERWGEPEQRL